ncbi:hypothetical protein [Lysobacter gummosus]|uniref:hypothetical protein n=1 Tax=Lysobacter gummosus TaxID=262324 RepID=UPI003624DE04
MIAVGHERGPGVEVFQARRTQDQARGFQLDIGNRHHGRVLLVRIVRPLSTD